MVDCWRESDKKVGCRLVEKLSDDGTPGLGYVLGIFGSMFLSVLSQKGVWSSCEAVG